MLQVCIYTKLINFYKTAARIIDIDTHYEYIITF